jgi:hypothetical protein
VIHRLPAEERRAEMHRRSLAAIAQRRELEALALTPDPDALARERRRFTPTESEIRMADKQQAAQQKAESDAGQDQVQSMFDTEQEQGYRGEAPDPTPNEHYTVKGVTSDKPTPENDPDQAAKARAAVFGQSAAR